MLQKPNPDNEIYNRLRIDQQPNEAEKEEMKVRE